MDIFNDDKKVRVITLRKNFGYQLAKESDDIGDIVVPVPDSGVPAAIGYSQYKKKGFQ